MPPRKPPELAKKRVLEAGDDATLGDSCGSATCDALAAAVGSGDGETFHSDPVPLETWVDEREETTSAMWMRLERERRLADATRLVCER